MATLYYESSFAHHGVKGQKWGVRRFQNSDGSLTKRGKKHVREIIKGRSEFDNLAKKIRSLNDQINASPLNTVSQDFMFSPGIEEKYLSKFKDSKMDNEDKYRAAKALYFKDRKVNISSESKKMASLIKERDWTIRDFTDSLYAYYGKYELKSIDKHNARAFNWDVTMLTRQELAKPINYKAVSESYKHRRGNA